MQAVKEMGWPVQQKCWGLNLHCEKIESMTAREKVLNEAASNLKRFLKSIIQKILSI